MEMPSREILKRAALGPSSSAFTLVEVLVAMGVIGIVALALYGGLLLAGRTAQTAREGLRADQILQDKLEAIRLCTWSQITSNNFIPSTFTNYLNGAGGTNLGTAYSGSVQIANSSYAESYASGLKLVIVNVNWQSGTTTRQREMRTLLSSNGLCNYIY